MRWFRGETSPSGLLLMTSVVQASAGAKLWLVERIMSEKGTVDSPMIPGWASPSGEDTMIRFIESLSFARVLTLVASLIGIALMSLERRTRIVLLWLAALSGGLVAAMTIFSGIGFFLMAIVIAYLWAAWRENEAGE
jgi:hypothetical protein